MATLNATFAVTSKAGNTRTVRAEVIEGKLWATFTFTPASGGIKVVSKPQPLIGGMARLSNFSINQGGLFCKWVDSKLVSVGDLQAVAR